MTYPATATGHIPSVSELQAALVAARHDHDATTVAVAATLPSPATGSMRPAAASISTPVPPARPQATAQSDVAGVWLLGTHGGSGARCLSAALPDTRCAGRAWPRYRSSRREPVVLVCRANHRGLTAAQDYARAYRDEGLAERLQLLGVIVSADAPGRSPSALRRLERLLSGAAPILGHVPWEPSWRVGPAVAVDEPLPWVTKLAEALSAAVGVRS